MMPKWMIAFIAAALAGVVGLACGALLTRPDRQEVAKERQALEDRLRRAETEIVRLEVGSRQQNRIITAYAQEVREAKGEAKDLKAKLKSKHDELLDVSRELADASSQRVYWTKRATKAEAVAEQRRASLQELLISKMFPEGPTAAELMAQFGRPLLQASRGIPAMLPFNPNFPVSALPGAYGRTSAGEGWGYETRPDWSPYYPRVGRQRRR